MGLLSNSLFESNFFIDRNRDGLGVRINVGEQDGILMDADTPYRLNQFGFRDEEFTHAAEMVAIGCSFTFGLGIPREAVWASVLAEKLGVEYHNLGIVGAGMHRIVMTFLNYCNDYGTPRIVYGLFPDFRRITFNNNDYRLPIDGCIPTYSKAPHRPDDILTIDYGLWNNLSALYVLESFCKASGIELIWSNWDGDAVKFLDDDEVKDERYLLDSYKKIDRRFLTVPWEFTDCHLDLKEKYPEYFEWGKDIEYGKHRAHWGVHTHAHFAESFLK
jgi:hypothetical protein